MGVCAGDQTPDGRPAHRAHVQDSELGPGTVIVCGPFRAAGRCAILDHEVLSQDVPLVGG